jgi:hypothetical protein
VSPYRVRLLWSLPLGLPVLAVLAAHCGSRVVYAVDLAGTTDGAALSMGTDGGAGTGTETGTGAGTEGGTGMGPDTGVGVVGWPNATSNANSDPWIVANHDSLTEMRPRLLVLNFYNKFDPQQAKDKAQERILAIADSSRYHGYMGAGAPAFLNYALLGDGVRDLTDYPRPPPYTDSGLSSLEASSRLPVDANGAFDYGALFTQAFATNAGGGIPAYGITDPNSARYLTLCELFERGAINELWLMTGDESTSRRPHVLVEYKQAYNGQNQAISGTFEPCTGYDCWPASVPSCKVTARIAYLSPSSGVGCDLVSHPVGMENTQKAIPYLADNASNFFNTDFTKRFGTPFNRWADLWCASSSQTNCISYPSQTVAQGRYMEGGTWRLDPFAQGCGTAHFPPNARGKWDYANSQLVQSRCEHYRMQDGRDGGDLPDLYSSAKEALFAPDSGDDCAGGWEMYLRQSMPGLHNLAYAIDGSPMKNWWPFLFY